MDQKVSRRAVVGAAWAVPAVALAVATPFASASTTGSDTITLTPTTRNFIGAGSDTIQGVVSVTDGTMPSSVEVTFERTQGQGTLTVTPASPAVTLAGIFSFTVDAAPGATGPTTFLVTATPDNAADTVFVPGGNVLTLTVFQEPA